MYLEKYLYHIQLYLIHFDELLVTNEYFKLSCPIAPPLITKHQEITYKRQSVANQNEIDQSNCGKLSDFQAL